MAVSKRMRSFAADLLLAAGLTALSVVSAHGDSSRGAHVPTLTYPLMLGFLPAIALRRRWPGTTFTLMALMQAGLVVLRTQPSANVVAWLVAPYSVAAYASRRVQLVIATGTWGFTPADIAVPAMLWHGEIDRNVPVAHGRRLADALPHCHPTFVPEAGHYLIFDRWPEVLTSAEAPAR